MCIFHFLWQQLVGGLEHVLPYMIIWLIFFRGVGQPSTRQCLPIGTYFWILPIGIRCCSFWDGQHTHHKAATMRTEHNVETKIAKTALQSNVQDKQRANLESKWNCLQFRNSKVYLCMCMYVQIPQVYIVGCGEQRANELLFQRNSDPSGSGALVSHFFHSVCDRHWTSHIARLWFVRFGQNHPEDNKQVMNINHRRHHRLILSNRNGQEMTETRGRG